MISQTFIGSHLGWRGGQDNLEPVILLRYLGCCFAIKRRFQGLLAACVFRPLCSECVRLTQDVCQLNTTFCDPMQHCMCNRTKYHSLHEEFLYDTLMSRIEWKYCLISTSYLAGLFDIFMLLHIWQNWLSFGDLLPMRTLCDAIMRNLNLISIQSWTYLDG